MGHRCKNKELHILLVEGNKDDRAPEAVDQQHEEGDLEEIAEDQPVLGEVAALSLNYVVGISTLKTLKLHVQIENQVVVVLIDCGDPHYFISVELVERLGIPCLGTHSIEVFMGTGILVKGEGICKGVILKL